MKRLFPRRIHTDQSAHRANINFGRATQIHNAVYLYIFLFIICFSFLVLGLRLFQLTVVSGSYYRRLSEENRIKEIVIEPKRGTILDRKGFVLAENKEGNIDSKEERIESKRTYLIREEVAHLVGYRQLADKENIQNDNCVNKLRLGDRVGKKGIEKMYDCDLRGVPGKKLTEVDAKGKSLKTLSVIPPKDGVTVRLAIDLDLQKKAYEAIKKTKAAVVGLVPATGEVLVFVSSPSYDPQKFEDGDRGVESYFKDEEKPLFNRVAEGSYPPGSLFKLFVATGALEEKKITSKTIIEDTGTIKAGPLSFGNWYFLQYGKTEGLVDITKALRRSNDIYFYKAGEALGAEGIKKWAGIFGLGKQTHVWIDEAEGVLPSPFWKEETLHEKWYLGDTYNYSIGQGYTLLSPIQIAQGALPFANGGKLCQPKLLKGEKPSCQTLDISKETQNIVKEGMKQACEPGGTGWPLFDFKVKNTEMRMKKLQETPDDKKASVEASLDRNPAFYKSIQTGCKTGTAESHAKSGAPHAWFTVFAPYDNPEIMLTVLVEEGGQGSDIAAPIAKDILKAYFERGE